MRPTSQRSEVVLFMCLTCSSKTQVVMQAVKKDGLELKRAHSSLRNDKVIVLAAVRQNGDALQYASEDLKKDPEVVAEAIQEHSRSILFSSWALGDLKLVTLSVQKDFSDILSYVKDKALRGNRDLVLQVLERDGMQLKYADVDLQGDLHIVATAVRKSGSAALQHAKGEVSSNTNLRSYAEEVDRLKAAWEEVMTFEDFMDPTSRKKRKTDTKDAEEVNSEMKCSSPCTPAEPCKKKAKKDPKEEEEDEKKLKNDLLAKLRKLLKGTYHDFVDEEYVADFFRPEDVICCIGCEFKVTQKDIDGGNVHFHYENLNWGSPQAQKLIDEHGCMAHWADSRVIAITRW